MTAQRILAINPNSNEGVTRDMSAALEPLRFEGGPRIDCLTLAEGPPGIESQLDSDTVIAPLCRLIAQEAPTTGAFVIACFSDPGLHAAREVVGRTSSAPVLGIAEAGVTTALNLGSRVGVWSILANSVARHRREFMAMGVQGRIAADLPLGLTVAELADEERTFARMAEVGTTLRDTHGADVLVMGCAGMARYRAALEEALAVPVIDPTQAAVGMALTLLRVGRG